MFDDTFWPLYPRKLPPPFGMKYSFSKLYAMSGCLARGGIGTEISSRFGTTNEYALLGQVVHRYIERLSSAKVSVADLWEEVCEEIYQKARAMAIVEPPRPDKWAGYHAKRIATERLAWTKAASYEAGLEREPNWAHEVRLEHPSEPYFGILDLLRNTMDGQIEILDLKTGPVQNPLSSNHQLQLGFYGFLAESAMNRTVSKLGIISVSGTIHSVSDVEKTIDSSRAWADSLRSLYESTKHSWSSLFEKAQPSTNNCRGCELRPGCKAFLQDTNLHKATAFVSGVVTGAGVADNRSAWATLQTDLSGSATHVSGLPTAPDVGSTIAIMEGTYLAEKSIKAGWNSKLVTIDAG